MLLLKDIIDDRLVTLLKNSGCAVIRTDTLYGLVARADDRAAVQRIYRLKKRRDDKPCIVLIADERQLYDPPVADMSEKWPGPVSVAMPSSSAPEWLRRDGPSVAYRCPADERLRQLITETGPLIAPSANPEGKPPALTLQEAQVYFGDDVDAYVDGGMVPASTSPSELWQVNEDGIWLRLR